MAPLYFSRKVLEKVNSMDPDTNPGLPTEPDVDIDLREVYFLIMHFLAVGPCKKTYGQFWNELLEHQLLPRRYHAWYSRNGARSEHEDDDGTSLPLCYSNLVERYPHIAKDHLLKLLKELIVSCSPQLHGVIGGTPPNAADIPTILGTGSFSLLASDRDSAEKRGNPLPGYLRWPHMQADQVRGLRLREIGGGFNKHHRAPSVHAACYAVAKPSTLVQKMQVIKKMRGHQNAVYCAIFDRSGQYVITGSDDRLVKIWSMETAFCLASCRGHEGDITDLAVSCNNALVASSSNDFIIRVWRLPDGLPISVLRGHTGSVTAIAFSPRSVYQLLSSSDDGTCRIWDARHSQLSPRIYVPKPADALAGKSSDPSSSVGQQNHQILCCAYNANGTVFVTGSSDTYARVWNACKSNPEDSEQPNHEMDLLSGHENDVNYAQFSGCPVASRTSTADSFKEDNVPKFKNSWFTHDNIVTCSRDGSAIIWIPKSRRSHGKVGRWTRAYHLKVPPPPMPPQPARGGPRQRFQPTPRGVNMIVWSLDNRFVLAAIMDCRICVWNASDGSLVHSLVGHSESTFVLDVHPFNPRIAMSAGYDGKTIIWDIWEGTPVRIYETGRFKLVDGKFSPDGTSIVLSDEVGHMFIIATGQGESQKDAKFDQFFLGDYRPLIQDTNGNVVDQETQLIPYRRNIQDLLCDSSMVPYPDPYQSIYQQRRLGTLGIEWRPSSVKLATGFTYNPNTGDYQMPLILDPDGWVEPLPEFLEAINWEPPENEVQSEDNDSEYNVTDEYSSEAEHESLSSSSSGEPERNASDSGVQCNNKDGLRRSKRKKHKSKAEFMTSSGRRVKKRNLDEHDGATTSRTRRKRRLSNGRLTSKKKSSKSKAVRPQRRSAKNALSFLSKITGSSDDEEDVDLESSCSESESDFPDSSTQSIESEGSMHTSEIKRESLNNLLKDETEDVVLPSQSTEVQPSTGNRRRLVLKLPCRDSKAILPSEETRFECHSQEAKVDSFSKTPNKCNLKENHCGPSEPAKPSVDVGDAIPYEGVKIRERGAADNQEEFNISAGYNGNTIRWGEVKARSSKRLKLGETSVADGWTPSNPQLGGPNLVPIDVNGHLKSEDGYARSSGAGNPAPIYNLDLDGNGALLGLNAASTGKYLPDNILESTMSQKLSPNFDRQHQAANPATCNGSITEPVCPDMRHQDSHGITEVDGIFEPVNGFRIVRENKNASHCAIHSQKPERMTLKFRIRSNGSTKERTTSSSKLKSAAVEDLKGPEHDLISNSSLAVEHNSMPAICEEDEGTSGQNHDHIDWDDDGSGSLDAWADEPKCSRKPHFGSNNKMCNVVYKRSKSTRSRKFADGDSYVIEGSTSNVNNQSDALIDGVRRTRSMGTKMEINECLLINNSGERNRYSSSKTSRNGRGLTINGQENNLAHGWKPTLRSVGLRSARSRRENYDSNLKPLDSSTYQLSGKKLSWLMLIDHEESYRYIPQLGDEVAYLRQGHEEYIKSSHRPCEGGPLKIKGLNAVEFCKVQSLDYSTLPGSGESCCKLVLELTDPASDGFGKTFKLTLPELVAYPDFLVERSRYDAAIERNWRYRDKCQVWWRNEDGASGSWWLGRIQEVKPISAEFPESPWERYVIRYKSDPSGTHPHSPWELHDADSLWQHPHINEDVRDKLLSCIAKLERESTRKDKYGIQKLNQVARKSDFLNRFPVPLSLEMIKRRLENNYYRTLEAVKHDASVMLSNAESYFGKNTEMTTKMRRLSEWVDDTFPSYSL
ncbi:uncharacterized protein A4U43_C07F12390 [Asparagus officinalis]|uniref:Bromo domain-containing protein n=1 Tax=Asparagus officinalis TaxID=4686 RepID=A0A5P1EBD9_ASPOF|nr:uncharacterized protein LOC109848682 [Asparagus officinalis]ONK63196.1 uncharacterized protein A4U43_C07F12390 [Asparagus officinalis]